MMIELSESQVREIERLRTTNMNDEPSESPKDFATMLYNVIERGVSSIDQTRKQYKRTRLAVKMYGKK